MIKAYLYPTPAQLRDAQEQQRRNDYLNEVTANGLLEPPDDLIDALIGDYEGQEFGTSRFTQPLDEDFVWRTHSGEEYYPEDMATMHLFYTVRMLFNNTCPAAFRVGKFRRYRDVADWSPEYVQQAGKALYDELESRDDLDLEVTDSEDGETIQDQMTDIEGNALVLKRLGIDAENPVS